MWTLFDLLIGLATSVFLFFANWGDEPPTAGHVATATYTTAARVDQKNDLDIYRSGNDSVPASKQSLNPVLFFIHGGGLMIGDKNNHKQLGHKFASLGYTTVLVNHRLSPEVSHPDHIEDIATAFAWVQKHIAEYGGDPSRVFVAGHSSGGYLGMLLATNSKYLAKHQFSPEHIRGVVAISGFFHIERLAEERPKSVWSEQSERWPDASPANHLEPGLPPTLLLYAEHDNDARKLESIDLGKKIEALGTTPVDVHQIADRNHATIGMYMMTKEDMASTHLLDFMGRNVQ
ncbi:MAG: alpha/beta hydrolase [Pseudomonadales bacterium]